MKLLNFKIEDFLLIFLLTLVFTGVNYYFYLELSQITNMYEIVIPSQEEHFNDLGDRSLELNKRIEKMMEKRNFK